MLSEEASTNKRGKLLHLFHPEDMHIQNGSDGFNQAVSSMTALHKKLSGENKPVKVTTKYDGSPAIVFGHHPDNGKFFVGTKSVFNDTKPKINYTHDEIKKNHTSEELISKLGTALTHLPAATPKEGVYQGDMMYRKSSIHTTNGKHEIQPNTITYSTKQHTNTGQKMNKAELGMVVHTKYVGKNFASMRAIPDVDHQNFDDKVHAVHFIKPEHDLNKVKYSDSQKMAFESSLESAHALHKEVGSHLSMLPKEHIKTYINSTVRGASTPNVNGLIRHVDDRFSKHKISSRQHALVKTHIENNKDMYQKVLDIHNHMRNAKNQLVNALDTHSGEFETHVGKKAIAGGEGYVLHHKGHITKLVNREPNGFAASNFAFHKNHKP